MIVLNTWIGSATSKGPIPFGRRRPAPLGVRAPGGRLTLEAFGETSERDDDRGRRPGRGGRGPGPGGYARRGAGE